MEKTLNRYRILQLLLVITTWAGLILNGYDYNSTMLFVNLCLFGNLLLIMSNSGVVSTKFILSFIIYIVALAPGMAYYLLGFKLYSYVNFEHQINDSVTIKVLWLYFISSNLYTYVVLAKDSKLPDLSVPIKNETRLPFYFMCALVILFTMLGNSGPSLLTVGYRDLFDSRSSLISITSIVATVFWVDAYGKTRVFLSNGNYFKVRIFWLMTLFIATWLLLHASRMETIGFVSMLLIHSRIQLGKTPYKTLVFALLVGLLLYLVGYLRTKSLANIDLENTLAHAFQLSFESGANETEFANMPSGLGNIAATMQTTVYHFDVLKEPFLNGFTMFTYPLKLLPTFTLSYFDLANANDIYYNEIVLHKYQYNGGLFIFAPAYGNFGTIGLAVASLVTAGLVNWTQKAIRSSDYLKIIIAATVIFTFIRVSWYSVLPLPKVILYNGIVLFYVAMIFNRKRKGKVINSKPIVA